jgi:hypothetical protein
MATIRKLKLIGICVFLADQQQIPVLHTFPTAGDALFYSPQTLQGAQLSRSSVSRQ